MLIEKLIFLDYDGVLNNHVAWTNQYCGILPECVAELCSLLSKHPDAKIIVSSAWRYMILSGDMSLKGFEYMLLIHGADYDAINDKIIDHTPSDEAMCIHLGLSDMFTEIDYEWLKENGADLRVEQILFMCNRYKCDRFVILDDLPLNHPNLVQTNPDLGLTTHDIELASRLLL